MSPDNPLQHIPAVDKLLSSDNLTTTLKTYGHTRTTQAIRSVLTEIRQRAVAGQPVNTDIAAVAAAVTTHIEASSKVSLTPVLNLTGTVLHTNLGRASLPDNALAAITQIAGGNSNLEYDVQAAQRGDRDDHVEALLQQLTGAEAVTVVNNNAAAVMICLNTFAFGKEVCISRGELVEIGGSFRIPEVMEKSGCVLREVGATNRSHLKDYENAISENTGLLMKVHTSNYEIRGFTKEVSYQEIAGLAATSGVPFLADLGSGTLVNLEDYGLEHEPTVQEVIEAGADIITFSGDKLLGGPQAGLIAGKKSLIDAIKKNPLKRALRVDKMTLAALSEVLKLYLHPETLGETLPTLRHLSRTVDELSETASALLPVLQAKLATRATVEVIASASQIGSGALPTDQLPSIAIALTPTEPGDRALQKLTADFRQLPIPVIGRLQDGRLLFDLRTLDQPAQLTNQMDLLAAS